MKTIIFDLDGTIINTLTDLKNAINFGLSSFNFPQKTENEIKSILGRGITKTLQTCAPKEASEEQLKIVADEFLKHYSLHYKDNTLPYNGVKELLIKLKEKYQLVVLTNKKQFYAEDLINTLLPNIFDVVQGSYPDKPKKPDPYLASKVLQELNLSPEEAVYVGDTEVDFETGKNATLSTILITYGFRNKKELQDCYPEANIAESFDELIKKINLILG